MSGKLLELLVEDTIAYHLKGNSAEEVIRVLSEKLEKAGYVRESFVSAALDRESRLPTGLPLSGQVNAAIPHTEVEHVIKAGLAMATLEEPVPFNNMINPSEAVPVQLVFVMALDQPKSQVEMLQEIAGVLQNEKTVNKLMAANQYADIKAALS